MNANAIEKEAVLVNNETVQSYEDFSCLTDCNWGARQWALATALEQEDRSPGGELMQQYNFFFNLCMEGC
ncbi:hypothetical protein [Winogradskyella sp. UBA3174]|uniref:hypothetical protein n=1 Tax=Winogradskyella sp. UBA3174 TaxID=1947785 RepID=UPI0025F609D3|nr:hypothetical protein [Winogradskyella sp. UBA3174]|tara:strand:- start:58968 stop:59177 length:210 start_codon:yes stop_codon:yes gene_type:complete